MNREHSRRLAAAHQSILARIAARQRRQTLKEWLIDILGALIIVGALLSAVLLSEALR